MEVKEYMSKHLGVPYLYLANKGQYLCNNGVMFTKKEYLDGIDLQKEYKAREEKGELYDYDYAKSTGKLRKLNKGKTEEIPAVLTKKPKTPKSIGLLCFALLVTSFGSMYISTVHTATYLLDYVDVISAWLMSGVITVYCSTAFEVVILFHDTKRHVLSVIFALLWGMVILFSMTTTVSVFYDKFNFSTVEKQTERVQEDAKRLGYETLKKKEESVRESIKRKEQDIAHRQSLDYATRTQQVELNALQNELQEILDKQLSFIESSPVVSVEESKAEKESIFDFLGRLFSMEGGVLEFIMSTLGAVFINLISPLSVSVVVNFLGGKNENDSEHN